MIRRLFRMLVVGVLLATVTVPAFAGTDTDFGITVTTPDTYGSCSATGDTITVTGLTALNNTNPNPDVKFTLEGPVNVQFVLPDGSRQTVPNGFQNVVMAADGTIQVTYPPAGTWPLSDPVFDTAEIHVDLSLELVARNIDPTIPPEFLHTFGSGLNWDVFCQHPPRGCTPGFWKNHRDAWVPTGYSPSQTIGSVFVNASAFPTLANSTLLQGLSFPGGSTLQGAAQTLLRAGIAAALNAAYPGFNYPLSTGDVISQVNSALASNRRSTMLNLATILDADNNFICPLN